MTTDQAQPQGTTAALLRREHQNDEHRSNPRCYRDGLAWPCDTLQALDLLDAQARELEALRQEGFEAGEHDAEIMNGQSAEIERLSRELEEVQILLTQAETQIQAEWEDIGTTFPDKVPVAKQLANAQRELEAARQQRDQLDQANQTLSGQNADLGFQFTQAEAELEAARASADITAEGFAQRLSEAEYLSAQCREALEAARAENSELRFRVDAKGDEIARLGDQIRFKDERLAEAERRLGATMAQSEEWKRCADDEAKALDETRVRLAKAESRLVTAQDGLVRHHEHLSDDPRDICSVCDLTWNGATLDALAQEKPMEDV